MSELYIYRILDANLNRLREGLRVVEEYFRFGKESGEITLQIKELRHLVREIDDELPRDRLLESRNVDGDIFSSGSSAKELDRASIVELISANIRRSEESARVLEEYLKLLALSKGALLAKDIRFSLYKIESSMGVIDGSKS